MRRLLAVALPIVLVVLVPSTASAHHHHYDGLRIKDEVYCIRSYDDPGGPVTGVTFEGAVLVTEKRADVRDVRLIWRVYNSMTGLSREWGGRESPLPGRYSVSTYAFSEDGSYMTATVRFMRPERRDILHTREVARWPAGNEICY